MNAQELGAILADMQTEELALVIDEMEKSRFLKKIEPILMDFRALGLTVEQTEKLCAKLKHIAWCENGRMNHNNKGEKL